MPVVITCPECQQRARVPDAMLGKSVKCPECGATFAVPAESTPPIDPQPPTVVPAPPEPSTRPPLPYDPDSLRSVRSGAGVQLLAQCLYAAAFAHFSSRYFSSLRTPFPAARSLAAAPRPAPASHCCSPCWPRRCCSVAGLLSIVGASISFARSTRQAARGLAIATLLLTLIAFEQLLSASSRLFFLMDDMPGRFGGFGPQFWISGAIILWLVEIARLCVLAAFWRAMSRILRDNRGEKCRPSFGDRGAGSSAVSHRGLDRGRHHRSPRAGNVDVGPNRVVGGAAARSFGRPGNSGPPMAAIEGGSPGRHHKTASSVIRRVPFPRFAECLSCNSGSSVPSWPS